MGSTSPAVVLVAMSQQIVNVQNALMLFSAFVIGLSVAFFLFRRIASIVTKTVSSGKVVEITGTWGGPELGSKVDWEELDRRAAGSLEHDAMV